MATASTAYSCKMTGKWDWVTSNVQGKVTEGRELYMLNDVRLANVSNVQDNYGFDVIERKNKVRGSGKALVLRFESEPGKDFELLGWAVDVTGVSQ